MSAISLGASSISAYGTTTASVTVSANGTPVTTPVTVDFTSTCAGSSSGGSSKATLTASSTTVNGVATATYTDNGCSQPDTITASVSGTTISKSTTLTVAAPSVASVQFISATPETIVLTGTGNTTYAESSLVTFKVVDTSNNPVPNQSVSFWLSTVTGGILLDNTANVTSSAVAVTKQTTTTGLVSVTVKSGTNPTPVWVNASTVYSGQTFSTQSTKLTVSTGRPAQDRFSLSVSTHSIEGWDYDGETTTITARASDRVGNPVPDGTTVNFVSEGAQIGSSCQTASGACSVTFTSANYRPTQDYEPVLGANASAPAARKITKGRVTVLAYTQGEESFIDSNGNNSYDSGESFTDLGDVYIDSNEDQSWTTGEQYVPYNGTSNTSSCTTNAIATSHYAPSKANTCDGVWGQAHVRQQQTIILAASTGSIAKNDGTYYSTDTTFSLSSYGCTCANDCTAGLPVRIYDANNNPMPAGTTIATVGTLPTGMAVTFGAGSVGDSTNPGGTTTTVFVYLDDNLCQAYSSGSLTLSLTTPNGVVSGNAISLTKP
jgi:hypothetical protein